MDLKQLKAAIGKPQVEKLKAVGKGVRIGLVLGDRVLVKPIIPYTEMDEVEKKGLLYMPEQVKKDNTPLPSMGIVVQCGEGMFEHDAVNLALGTGVLFSKFGGTDFVIDTVDYKILDTAAIMATFVVEEEGEIALVGEAASSESSPSS